MDSVTSLLELAGLLLLAVCAALVVALLVWWPLGVGVFGVLLVGMSALITARRAT